MADFKGYINAARVAASTVAVAKPCALLGIAVAHTSGAAPASIVLQDSTSSSGGTVAVIDMSGFAYIEFPGQGFKMLSGVYVDIGGAEAVTIFYG